MSLKSKITRSCFSINGFWTNCLWIILIKALDDISLLWRYNSLIFIESLSKRYFSFFRKVNCENLLCEISLIWIIILKITREFLSACIKLCYLFFIKRKHSEDVRKCCTFRKGDSKSSIGLQIMIKKKTSLLKRFNK